MKKLNPRAYIDPATGLVRIRSARWIDEEIRADRLTAYSIKHSRKLDAYHFVLFLVAVFGFGIAIGLLWP